MLVEIGENGLEERQERERKREIAVSVSTIYETI
jgi:hypothetical protein